MISGAAIGAGADDLQDVAIEDAAPVISMHAMIRAAVVIFLEAVIEGAAPVV